MPTPVVMPQMGESIAEGTIVRWLKQPGAAVKKGDGEAAQRLMAEHIRASKNEALAHYDRVQAGPDTRTISLGLPDDLLEDLQRIESGAPAPIPPRKPRLRSA